jgi:hypothetical protein
MAVPWRTQRDSEREAFHCALGALAQSRPARHAAASFWTAMVVLAAWLLLIGGSVVLFAATRDVRLAETLGRVMPIPAHLLWLASAFGLIKGILGLLQPHGKKALAAGGSILNGLLCLAPLGAVLVLVP